MGVVVGVAVLLAMAFAATTAAAVTIAPGGDITATSLGPVALTSEIATLHCSFTFTGSIATSGTINTRVGSITGGSIAGCEDGYTMQLLVGSGGPLRLISAAGSPITSVLLQIENIGIQFNFLGSPICLLAGTLGFRYTEGGLMVLLANTLTGDCGSYSMSTGTQFSLSPAQDIT